MFRFPALACRAQSGQPFVCVKYAVVVQVASVERALLRAELLGAGAVVSDHGLPSKTWQAKAAGSGTRTG